MTDRALSVSSAAQVADVAAVLQLCTRSSWHSDWNAADIVNWILPPLALGQYLLMREGARPVAYASWAFVAEDAHQALKTDARPLLLQEWQGGQYIWLVDLIAPFGHVRQFVRLLRRIAVENGLEHMKRYSKRRYTTPPRALVEG